MAWEIERRFLARVSPGDWPKFGEGTVLRQGYLRTGDPAVRIRVGEPRGPVLTRKSGVGVRREENEWVVEPEVAEVLLFAAGDRVVEKVRWRVGSWELDRFLGSLDGLVILEVELQDEEEPLPDRPLAVTILREVTDDGRFVSSRIASLDAAERRAFVRALYGK